MFEVIATGLNDFNRDNIKVIHFLNKSCENYFAWAYAAFILEVKQVNMVKTFTKL